MEVKRLSGIAVSLLAMPLTCNASASLFELALSADGVMSDVFAAPAAVDCTALPVACATALDADGIGSISFEISGAGAHSIGLYADYEIDEAAPGSFYNEYGAVIDAAGRPAGLSWEIDEPGYVYGDIFANFSDGWLDNTNGVPADTPDDVSLALIWDFTLAQGEVATLDFVLSSAPPASGFALAHYDDASSAELYLSASLSVTAVPLPPAAALMLFGLSNLAGFSVWSSRRKPARRLATSA